MYHHFPAVGTVHFLVLNIQNQSNDLFKWLIDIQCRRRTLVPVVIVFTHLDKITSKAERDHVCQERLAWIAEHIIGHHGAMMQKDILTNSLRSFTDSHNRYDSNGYLFCAVSTHQTGSAAHLMPYIMAVAFVSNTTGYGISQLRSRVFKTLTEPIPNLRPILGPLGMGINVPAAYIELSQVVYNLRLQGQRSSSRGNEPFLYSIDDLKKRILLQVKNPPTCELLPVLQFMKQVILQVELFIIC